MDPARSWVTALAVRGERIVAVGHDPAVGDLIGPSTRVIELHGRTVTPGFQDAHVHPVHGGLSMLRCDLHADAQSGPGLDIIDAELRRVYAGLGHPERWSLLRYDVAHQETPEGRQAALAFLRTHLAV